MANIIMTKGDLITIAQLNERDILSLIIAGLCHDLGHDGFTNAYHSNALTDRGVMYNDQSVQESYHVARAFEILSDEKCNFLDGFSKDEFKEFRKRMIGCILSTDMAKHFADLKQLQNLIEGN